MRVDIQTFSTELLIGDTVFTSPVQLETGPPFYVVILAVCRAKAVTSFLSFLRPLVLVRPREANPRPPALQSNVLPMS